MSATLRLVREFTQHITATPAQVFPLLCPVRECDWLDGWAERCTLVYSASGVAEPGCVFLTASPAMPDTTWVVTRHDPEAGVVEFARVCPGWEAVTLSIAVRPEAAGSLVAIRYTITSLPGSEPAVVQERWAQDGFDADLAWWEASMNHYLATGSRLAHAPQDPHNG